MLWLDGVLHVPKDYFKLFSETLTLLFFAFFPVSFGFVACFGFFFAIHNAELAAWWCLAVEALSSKEKPSASLSRQLQSQLLIFFSGSHQQHLLPYTEGKM